MTDTPQSEITHLSGEYTDAVIMLPEEEIEDNLRAQVQEMIDHEAFTEPVKIMPDAHIGSGACIGFTMPLSNKIVPGVVGLDIGCGLTALKIGDELSLEGETLDTRIRDRVPMGWGQDGLKAPNRDYYHIKDQFPWGEVNQILKDFIDQQDGAWIPEMEAFYNDGGYDIDYFKDLINNRAGTQSRHMDISTGISSLGTLGSGNHFVEIGESTDTGEYWVVVHSGSRGVGGNTAKYWQERAAHLRKTEAIRETLTELPDEYLDYVKFDLETVSDSDLLDWVNGAKGESFVHYDKLKHTFNTTDPDRIGEIGDALKSAIPDASSNNDDTYHYLENEEAAGYLIDMIFCQKYAAESRRVMATAVLDELDTSPSDMIESPHNIISFRDGIIRKGATEAYANERVIVPLNMADGILLVEGKSNSDWNYSVNHGAGRVMSRRDADDQFTEEELRQTMADSGAFATTFPTDESPGAYKDTDLIKNTMEPTATIIDHLKTVHNFKAE